MRSTTATGFAGFRFSSGIRDIGAGAFNGCRKIEELTVTENREEKSCLKEILSELNETVAVHYLLTGPDKDRPGSAPVGEENRAELLFPAFYEEAVENTPARITETHVHGCGHRYRYCFQNTRFQFAEYDSLFPYMKAQENVKEAVRAVSGKTSLSHGAVRKSQVQLQGVSSGTSGRDGRIYLLPSGCV